MEEPETPEEAQHWIDGEGFMKPIQIARGFGCCALGDEEVGLRVAYQESLADTRVKTVRIRLSPEHALELAARLRLYADRPRSPQAHRPQKPK